MTAYRALPWLLMTTVLTACSPATPPAAKPAEAAAAPAAAGAEAEAPAAEEAAGRRMAPEAYVQTLYAKDPDDGGAETRRALFEPGLAEAMVKDNSNPGEVGAIDFAWTCGCQDGTVTQLKTTHDGDIMGGAKVTARFLLEGEPRQVNYILLNTPTGYKIVDVAMPARGGDDAWSLRGLLGLAPYAE